MYERNLRGRIEAALADTPVVLINGARQVGKSTLVRSLADAVGVPYYTLDDATVLAAAAKDPVGFVSSVPPAVVIDEVQAAPGLFPAIKHSVDLDRRAGRFLLTGSANVLMLPRLADSLAGRMEIATLWPLSQGEIRGRREAFVDWLFSGDAPTLGPQDLDEPDAANMLVRGGYPEAVGREDAARRAAWAESYLRAILQRDVRDLAHIEGLTEMPRLLSLLAARSGGLLNVSDIARSSALPTTTVTRYLALLRTVFLFEPLTAWSVNLEKRLVKAPKVHLVDSGLAAHLAGYDADRLRSDTDFVGHLLESFVVSELRKQLSWSNVRAMPYHFRAVTGQEVDIVLETADGRVAGVEVKASASVGGKDFAGLELLSGMCRAKLARGVVLYRGAQVVPFGRFLAMPLSALWRIAPDGTANAARGA